MYSFVKLNRKIIIYTSFCFFFISLIGFKFFLSFVSNLLLLLVLIPILILLVLFVSLYSLKSKFKTCDECGLVTIGSNEICVNCGASLGNINKNTNELIKEPSESTIEINAEEVK